MRRQAFFTTAKASGSTPRWNFHKYLVAPDGTLAGAWPSRVKPDAREIVSGIEALLAMHFGIDRERLEAELQALSAPDETALHAAEEAVGLQEARIAEAQAGVDSSAIAAKLCMDWDELREFAADPLAWLEAGDQLPDAERSQRALGRGVGGGRGHPQRQPNRGGGHQKFLHSSSPC